MKLSQCLKDFEYEVIRGNVDGEIADVTSDSRKANKDNAFIAIVGAVADGHKFISNAYESGCRNFIVQHMEEEFDKLEDASFILTKDTRIALAYTSAQIFNHPASKLKTVAITGTKGKTTTTFMIKSILEQHGQKVGIIGTTGVYIGDKYIKTVNTTPESYDIQRFMNMMVEDGIDVCVMEVSSQALKLNRTVGIEFDYAIFTNLSPDHIGENEHKDYEEYVYCKSLLFKQTKHGIFNIDDKEAPAMMKDTTCTKETFGFSKDADLTVDKLDFITRPGFIGIGLKTKGTIEDYFEINTPGKFSAYNAMAAILTALQFNVTAQNIKAGLMNVFVRGRVEAVKVSDRFTLLIDYAHNAMSMESILTTIREYNPHRIVSLFGCGGNRSKLRRYEMGEISGKYADLSIITEDNSRFEDVNDIIEDIKVGINKTSGKYVVIPDRKDAIRYSIEHAQDGDIVLLLGKGHEDYQEKQGKRYPFDERVVVAEILEQLKKENINV